VCLPAGAREGSITDAMLMRTTFCTCNIQTVKSREKPVRAGNSQSILLKRAVHYMTTLWPCEEDAWRAVKGQCGSKREVSTAGTSSSYEHALPWVRLSAQSAYKALRQDMNGKRRVNA